MLGNQSDHSNHEHLHQQCDSLGASQSRLISALSRDLDSFLDVSLDKEVDLSVSTTEEKKSSSDSVLSQASGRANGDLDFAPRKLNELNQAPLSSQVS